MWWHCSMLDLAIQPIRIQTFHVPARFKDQFTHEVFNGSSKRAGILPSNCNIVQPILLSANLQLFL